MDKKELLERVSQANPERMDIYYRMVDRLLLYSLAVNYMPKDQLNKLINNADYIIKKTIDTDATNQTNFLHSTKEGRRARISGAADGEEVRLDLINTWELVKEIIKSNLRCDEEDDENIYED